MCWLIIGSITMTLLAALHSYAGEIRLLQPLFQRNDLPALNGSVDYTKIILRWAWHLTSIAWLGFAALFLGLIQIAPEEQPVPLTILAGILTLSGVIVFAVTRGRHPAWIFFLVATACTWMSLG
jgi:hypothetical protein